jgi:hypothetical protein
MSLTVADSEMSVFTAEMQACSEFMIEAVSLANDIYKTTYKIEGLCLMGKVRGNGHHARQKIAKAAVAELWERWINKESPHV